MTTVYCLIVWQKWNLCSERICKRVIYLPVLRQRDSSTPSDQLAEMEQFKFCLYVYRSMEMHERKKLVFKYLFSGMLFKPLNIYIPVL